MKKKTIYVALSFMTLGVLSIVVNGDVAKSSTPRKFTLVYNINNSGYVDVCGCKHKKVRNGSLTRRSSFLKQLRSTDRKVLLLDGGSSLFSVTDNLHSVNRDEAIRKSKLIVESYNRMGYRAMAIGVSDIAQGLNTLKDITSSAKFDLLSANFYDKKTGKRIFKPYAIYEIEGVRVGVLGLTLETMGSAYFEKAAPQCELRDPLKEAKMVVAEIKDKADLIIALSHIKQESNYKLIKELDSIGIVVDPFIEFQTHRTWIKEEEWLGALGETLFFKRRWAGCSPRCS